MKKHLLLGTLTLAGFAACGGDASMSGDTDETFSFASGGKSDAVGATNVEVVRDLQYEGFHRGRYDGRIEYLAYSFFAVAGDEIKATVEMQVHENPIVRVGILDAERNLIAKQTEESKATPATGIVLLTAPTTGNYYVVLKSDDYRFFDGKLQANHPAAPHDYRVDLDAVRSHTDVTLAGSVFHDPMPIAYGGKIDGKLSGRYGELTPFSFEGAAGDVVTIHTTFSSAIQLAPWLGLVNADQPTMLLGSTVAPKELDFGTLTLSATLPAKGTYWFLLKDRNVRIVDGKPDPNNETYAPGYQVEISGERASNSDL